MNKWVPFKSQFLQFTRRQSWWWNLRYWTIRHKFLDAFSSRIREANRLRKLSAASEHRGELETAIQLLIDAAGIYRTCGSPEKTLHSYSDLFDLYVAIGRNDEALEVCQNTTKYLETTSSDSILAVGFYTLGAMFATLHLNSKAIKYLRLVKKLFKEVGIEDEVALLDYLIAVQLRESGNLDEAINFLLNASKLAAQYGDGELLADCCHLLAEIYSEKKDVEREALFRGLERELVYGDKDHDPAADQIIEQPSDKLEKMSILDRKTYFDIYGSRFGVIGKEKKKALRYLEKAISVAEKIRGNLSKTDWRTSFLETSYDTYSHMISTCLDNGDLWKALGHMEQLKSRVLIEMLADRTGLASHRAKESAWDGAPDFSDMDQFFEEFPNLALDKTAVIFLFPDVTFTHILLLTGTGEKKDLFYETSSYGFDTASAHVSLLDKMIRAGEFQLLNVFLDDILEGMHAELFSPVSQHLAPEIERMIFVPYSIFHLLPLHAMFTEEKGNREYLIDKYVVTYAPSAKILNYCRSLDRSWNRRAFVSLADTKGDLNYSPYEAKAIAGMFGTEVNERITRDEMISKAQASHILHYAGHAEGEGLHLHQVQDSRVDDLYRVEEIFETLQLPQAWLATLSACETARVKIGKADEYIGLPSAFLHAGAATVISSLWCVPERSTTLLMCKMYEFMKEGFGKADSLHHAQLWLKNSKRSEHLEVLNKYVPWAANVPVQKALDTTRFIRKRVTQESLLPRDLSKPYYWAGFICTGAP